MRGAPEEVPDVSETSDEWQIHCDAASPIHHASLQVVRSGNLYQTLTTYQN